MLSGPSVRALGPEEVYYQLLGRLWPMNALCAVELEADAETVRAAWARLVELVPLLRARVRAGAERGGEVEFEVHRAVEPWATFPDLASALRTESSTPLDPASAASRVSLVEDGPTTTVVLCMHHALIDGRGIAQIGLLLGELVAGSEPDDHPLFSRTVALEDVLEKTTDLRQRRRELLALAREVRGEQDYVGHADRLPWHRPEVEGARDVEFHFVRLDRDQTTALLTRGRASRTTVHGLLVAAVLGACAAMAPGVGRLAVTTAVDLKGPNQIPADTPIGQAAGLIASSYDVTVPEDELARAITADIRRRVERGEGDLGYALSGADRLVVGPQSDEVVLRWTGDATPGVCVSNVGVVPDPVPPGVRRVLPNLAPTPNQVLFVAATTLHGELELVISYDRSRLDVEPAALTRAIRERLLAEPAGPAVP